MTEDLSDAYENGAYIVGAADYPPRWAEAAKAFRARTPCRLGLSYGEGPRHALDLFLPEGTPEGLMVFVHGGYWKAFDRSTWSHLAGGGVARGVAVAMPSYDLCPDVRIATITTQVARAVTVAAAEVAGPITLAGHSAGGHLVTRMLAPGMLPDEVRARITSVMPISPLSDLRPLMQTQMNATLRLDPDEARAESPVFQPQPAVPVHVWVGADERPAFVDQARWLAQAWDCALTIAPGQHHFDIIDGLRDPESALMRAVLP